MQIVIDITEEEYYDALQYVKFRANTDFENLMIDAIKNGTPLPKGHGDFERFLSLYNSWNEENKLEYSENDRIKYIYPQHISTKELNEMIEFVIKENQE